MPESGDYINAHKSCLMKEEWARIGERLKAVRGDLNEIDKKTVVTFQNYMVSQTTINTHHTEMIQKLMHRIYGNETEGLNTTVRLNRQTAESDNLAIKSSVTRLWYAFGLIVALMLANLGLLLKALSHFD